MTYLYIVLAVLAGIAVSIQIGVNNALRFILGSPVLAAFSSFAVGTIFLLAYALMVRTPWPSFQALAKVPAWAWLGGVLGAYYVATSVYLAPKLGAASLISIVVAAQMFTSMVLDHFGVIGFAQHSINIWRILGALLLIAGVTLIVRN